MLRKINRDKLLVVFLFVLLCIDFFGIGNLPVVCRAHQGFQFNHSTNFTLAQLDHYRFGAARISYNFAHFFIFWTQIPIGKTLDSVKDFLSLDGVAGQPSPLPWNIAHFFAFLIFVLVLLRFFRLKWYWVLIIAIFFNIFHEYISEGLCEDPSFNDLWVDTLGTLVAMLVWQILPLIRGKNKKSS
ncbi:MAG: hypothetical protein NTY61_00190 [Candidatus Parcubacteria bacterium]|nr:hypothetical protein [Candidatus Parcubacteria bacterium]